MKDFYGRLCARNTQSKMIGDWSDSHHAQATTAHIQPLEKRREV